MDEMNRESGGSGSKVESCPIECKYNTTAKELSPKLNVDFWRLLDRTTSWARLSDPLRFDLGFKIERSSDREINLLSNRMITFQAIGDMNFARHWFETFVYRVRNANKCSHF
uniref:AlNc14C436G11626 protein n=1 Tax=Albugo laibachii Nc14 TaxID=890382 RepID=F0WZN5_9STRA|nr:AlNc14C436G11626 [Albugo laibachii Nc14]|eukprot:CCA26960.1 AlNc14C436G11626 [Albugo laibachii Nc14]